MKKVKCQSCENEFHPWWLKSGVCNGCRNPELIVQGNHKGWTNQATWQVFTEISNDEKNYKLMMNCETKEEFVKTGRFLAMNVSEYVNWNEIYTAMKEAS